jgi:glutamate synthase (NADPH/NADH) small chain
MVDQRVLVIGGGDSAMDCARSAVRQGARDVTVAYRREAQAMRAIPEEQQAALEEGVHFRVECVPAQVLGDEVVTGVRFARPDGGRETIACDVLILAVGQVARPPAWLDRFNVQADEHGIIQVDENGRTSNVKIYAGGDNTNGPDLVVTAIAAGRQAARGILAGLRPTRRAQESVRTLLHPPAKLPETGLAAARSVQ